MAVPTLLTGPGKPLPLGLSQSDTGFNLAVFSRHATGVGLLVFDSDDREPVEVIALDPSSNRSGDIWHAQLSSDIRGKGYALRVEGPWCPDHGHRFDPRLPLIDPYAIALTGTSDWHKVDVDLLGKQPNALVRALVTDVEFDWQGDTPPRLPWSETVIYETHLRGLTVHPLSGVVHRGSYLGVIETIPYLCVLGITAIELMPVQEFSEFEMGHRTGKPLRNYWGYNPVALFAPKAGYASTSRPGAAVAEFKTMVRELHRAGIEVILDVVFNHTAEAGEHGPTFSFRGLDNSIYYLLEPETGCYIDYTGCGNTLNCNHPVVRSLIMDCLRHWVSSFHIDGFRFDLASILGRDTEGRLLANPPLLGQIAEDPLLRHTKLIAEAWDLGGAFQVGHFPGRRWAEWNSCFRDDVRRFWRGDPGMAGAFATRLCGSADLYHRDQESPINSINFVTCHDGFTLSDLVSYARKHNEANGDNNRDGVTENYSENNGVEGPTEDDAIESVRLRQIKNFLVTLLASRGVPMLLGGDELRRSQRGNNNAYCQDNEISWYDWRLAHENAGLRRFVSRLIAFRKAHLVLRAEAFYSDLEIAWFGIDGGPPEWHSRENRIGCTIREGSSSALCLLFNAGSRPCRFVLPAPPSGKWRVAIDTAQTSPADMPDRGCERTLVGEANLIERSSVILAC
ncbi:MAG TPA: glycogen debranching protein GlgX [Bradyrhizobium sp.]|uniref:glycogen debranching protein GlgX n=1 Tax=Bradyrhizobium sp. TaxID=376 RepID=UPI002CAE04A2|nr:glycogen debranching protein GlgX [Bradyrhizobium sp.]HLZ01084.1 glycogen debranching protein GlgX [Bradyrhizobium sp.]